MFNEPVDLTSGIKLGDNEIHIDDLDMKINNLYIDINPMEHVPSTFRINMTDDGNFYEYPLGEHTVSINTTKTKYVNIYGYGNTHALSFYFQEDDPTDITNLKIIANVKRPLFISIWRMLVVFGLMLFISVLKTDGTLYNAPFEKENKNKIIRQMAITCLFVLIWIFAGYKCTASHLLFDESTKPHHEQYKELAVALSTGNVALPFEPDEALKSVENPYDTIYLQANGIPYRADYAYYNGKYYVYFGIVPELLIYFPYYMLTGDGFPNHAAVFVFYSLFVLGTFLMFKRMCDLFFKEVPFAVYLMISSSVVTFGSVAYLYFTADLYSVPIMAAFAFTAIGLFGWMNALFYSRKNAETEERRNDKLTVLSYIFGSSCMALVAGCRPQMVLFSFLAIPLLWELTVKKRELFSKKSIGRTLAFCIPYVVMAAIVMWYNFARFGSVFDFGASYSLTNNDMNLRGFNIGRMLSGLAVFLFKPAFITGRFPFLHTTTFDPDYLGRIVTEHFYGGMIACNILTWALFLSFHLRKDLKKRNMLGFFAVMLSSGLIIGMLDADRAGVLQRYASETSFGIIFATAIMLLLLMDKLKTEGNYGGFRVASSFLKAGFIWGLAYTFMIICNTDSGITLIKYNPELFYRIASIFTF